MKINSKALYRILSVLIKAVPSKSPLPILDDFLFKTVPGRLTVTASDTEVSMTGEIECESITENTAFAVPAKTITDLLSKLDDGELKITYIDSEASVKFDWENGSSILPVFDADDYPERAAAGSAASTVTFQQAFLKDVLARMIPLVDPESGRPAVGSICFDVTENGTNIVATDTHVMTCMESPARGTKQMLLPHKAAVIIRSMLGKDGDVKVVYDDRNAEFTCGDICIVTALTNGKYPDYKAVIPQNNPNVVTVPRLKFISVLKRILTCANKAAMHVCIKLSFDQMIVSGKDYGFSTSATETMDCEYDGDDLEVGFKGTSLVMILEGMNSESVDIELLSPKKSVLIKPSGDAEKEEPVKSVIMPIMTN